MATKPQKDMHVLIVGAGTSGLLLAQGLKKAAIPFTLFESSTQTTYQTRPREWGMTLHWGTSYIRDCLPQDLVARFSETYADPSLNPSAVTGLPIHNGKTGALVMEMGAEKPVRVSRRKMRDLFKEGIDVQYGKAVERVDSDGDGKVLVRLGDGTSVSGDVLVGCDGAKSKIRECVCGEDDAKLTDVPVGMFNFPYMFEPELARRIRDMNSLFVTSIHPEHGGMFWLSIQDVPDPTRPETWTFQVLQSWLDSSIPASTDLSTYAGRMALFKQRAASYAEPWRSVGLAVSPTTQLPLDKATYWKRAAKWDNRSGRMTLCGDAAHPMTPHRGQGLNNALQDARNFVEAMVKVKNGEVELSDAVDAYDAEVLERGKAEMGVSLRQTLSIHDWGTLMQSPMVRIGMHRVEK